MTLQEYLNNCKNTKNNCLEYLGKTRVDGYARVTFERKNWLLHRLVFILHSKNQIPNGLFVLHSCDNRCCINPDHLWLGTKRDNTLDSIKKGRHVNNSGTRNGRAKLTMSKANRIRKAYKSGLFTRTELSSKFKVHTSTIQRVLSNKNWNND